MVELIVPTRTGGRHGRLVLFTSAEEPRRISDLFFLPDRRALPKPGVPLSTVSRRKSKIDGSTQVAG
jgi:hypothetical protein